MNPKYHIKINNIISTLKKGYQVFLKSRAMIRVIFQTHGTFFSSAPTHIWSLLIGLGKCSRTPLDSTNHKGGNGTG